MKRFYCVILAMLAVVLYAIVMSGCRAISSNVEVATQPVVETPLAEHIGKVRQGPFVNDAEEFVRNISVLLEEKSPHDYSVRRIEEILLNNGYLEEYFKGNTEPLALYCFEYIINHESLCYVSDNQNATIEDLRANCTEFSYWVINEKNDDIILEITSDTGNLIQVIIENAS